ncbi:hypothetical protein JFL43_20740 [Viridibacillus sp. YIM B01967]|uniref:DUF1129 domain-containing protein n=1 Tax=Viridibacillus soli TaxID=2798301 RepID=A0ABS1HCS2_9BACL|nr:hypothetical protein [Viridibacillus soli]MBK3497209.1 hypothetical protein [Viridibacillus soli]
MAGVDDKEDILKEIRYHLTEMAEDLYGESNEETLQKVIISFGEPRATAEKYTGNHKIISPSFQSHLLQYTGILFSIHFGVCIIALIKGSNSAILPFINMESSSSWLILFYLPVAFIFDFGLISLLLLLVTKYKPDASLPWFNGFKKKQPSKIGSALFTVLLVIVYWIYQKLGTIFMYIDVKGQHLYRIEATESASIGIIVILLISYIVYLIRFFYNKPWLYITAHIINLLILWYLLKQFQLIHIIAANEQLTPGLQGIFILFVVLTTFSLVRWLINYSVEKSLS